MNNPNSAGHLAMLHNAAFKCQRGWSETEFRDLLANEYCHAISGQHGFSLVRIVETEAELLTLAVHPLNQKKGLGRALLKQTMVLAASLGAKRVFLEVAADNAPAINLYSTSGFDVVGRRPRYYSRSNSTPIDALVMSRAPN